MTQTSPVGPLPGGLLVRAFLVQRGGGAALLAHAAVSPRAVLCRGVISALGGVGAIRMLFECLQFCQGDDVTALRSVPHCALRGRVVVVEAGRVGVEQLPPLVFPGSLDAYALRRVPHTLTRQKVSVHALPSPGLNDLHPLQPRHTQARQADVIKTTN